MKKILSLLLIVISVIVCKAQEQKIKEILKTPKVGAMISTQGTVHHVCHCSGLRCLIADKDYNCLEVEWGDENKSFKQSLKGSIIKVSGILKTKILTKKRVIESIEHAKEHQSKLKIREYKRILSWMNKHKKEKYTNYYIECISFNNIK